IAGASALPNDRRQPGLTKHSMSPMTSTSKVAISTSRSDRGNTRSGLLDMCFGPSDYAGVLELGHDNAVAGERSHRAVHSELQIFVCLMARTVRICSQWLAAWAEARNLFDECERAALAAALIPAVQN